MLRFAPSSRAGVGLSSRAKRGICTCSFALFVISCGVSPDAKSSVPSKRDTVANGNVQLSDSVPTARVTQLRAPATTDSDTARPKLIAARKKHDSVAFASTVAFGRRQMAKWPESPAPLPGSILPGHRIVAFYGNPLSKRMGVLGEYPGETMLAKLDTVVREWRRADPDDAGAARAATDCRRRAGRPRQGRDVSRAHGLGADREGVRLGEAAERAALSRHSGRASSTMQRELPRLMPFLSRPDVHLAMDAEFAMHHGAAKVCRPGRWSASSMRRRSIGSRSSCARSSPRRSCRPRCSSYTAGRSR